MTGFACQMPELFRKRGTLSPSAFKPLCSSGNVSLLWDIGALCAARWLIVAQCHLIKSLCRKYFYKLPKSRLAGKFQMCFHEKAVRSRWCLSPVLNVPKEHKGFMHPLRASPSESVLVHGRHFGFASASHHC